MKVIYTKTFENEFINHKVFKKCRVASIDYGYVDCNDVLTDLVANLVLEDGAMKKVSLTTCVKNNIVDITEFSDSLMDMFNDATVDIAEKNATYRVATSKRLEKEAADWKEYLKEQRKKMKEN